MSTIPKICLGKEVAREGFLEEGVRMWHFTYHRSGLMAAFQAAQAFLGVEHRVVLSKLQLPTMFGFIHVLSLPLCRWASDLARNCFLQSDTLSVGEGEGQGAGQGVEEGPLQPVSLRLEDKMVLQVDLPRSLASEGPRMLWGLGLGIILGHHSSSPG